MDKSNTKIVFIINSLMLQRCHKRVNDFIDQGYKVEVYGFDRQFGVEKCKYDRYDVEIIGEFNNFLSYFSRIGIMKNGIKKVIDAHKKQDCVFYLFQFDVASIATLMLGDIPYIYEESDLTHTYISHKVIRKVLEKWDKRIIRKSLMTVETSYGFVKYHFNGICPKNVSVIPNKLKSQVEDFPLISKPDFDINHIRFGYVGHIRFQALMNFVRILINYYPQHELYFFGLVGDKKLLPQIKSFEKCPHVHFCGPFENPKDLAKVYSQIDLLISTYDTSMENVRYAEPNKLYEAIYYETPIIVSKGTFLEESVKKYDIGYAIDALNDGELKTFINSLTEEDIKEKMHHAALIDKKLMINENRAFFSQLDGMLRRFPKRNA